MVDQFDTIIIGGGLSGLFLADAYLDSGNEDVFLITNSKRAIGGYALLGDMKIGFLPAGLRTSQSMPEGMYEHYCSKFMGKYSGLLIDFRNIFKSQIEYNTNRFGLMSKKYVSSILPKKNGALIIKSITKRMAGRILEAVVKAIRIGEIGYDITLTSGKILRCSHLAIATGRDQAMTRILIGMGEEFQLENELMIGCRATFEPASVLPLVSKQLDFRAINANKMQTYCFNYQGKILRYEYCSSIIYCGTLSMGSSIGNTFVGKKICISFDEAIQLLSNRGKLDYKDFIDTVGDKENGINMELKLFLTTLSRRLKIKFIDLYFPALEQFWPRPVLRMMSFESKKHESLYYIGDASGVAFGILQCYVTACSVAAELEGNK